MSRSIWIPLVFAIAVLLAHALAMRALFHGISLDDAYISYRYADNLAHGHGLTYNPGERVEGYSNFLWTLLLAPIARLGGDLTLPSHGLGLAFTVGSLLLAAVALWRPFGVHRPLVIGFTLLFLASSGYFAAWAVGGLEGPLFGFLLLGAWLRYNVEMESPAARFPFSALLFLAVALTRPEGVLIALAAAVVHVVLSLRRGHRLASRPTLLFPSLLIAPLLAYECWRLAYYGPHLFPNSVRAKTGGGIAQALRGFAYVGREFFVPYGLLLAPVVDRHVWRRPALATGLGLFLGYVFFIALAGGDWTQGRLFAPILPLGVVSFVAWLATRWERMPAWNTPPRRFVLGTLAAAYTLFAFGVTSWMREAPYRRDTVARDSERVAVGMWLRENMPRDTQLAVIAAGAVPYYSRLATHDMYGLNDSYIADLEMPYVGHGAPGHEKYDANYTLSKDPDIIIDGQAIPSLTRAGAYMSNYHVVQHFWKYTTLAFHRRLLQRLGQLNAPSGSAR